MRYRCSQMPVAAFFFTVVTHERKEILWGENPRVLKQAFETTKTRHPPLSMRLFLLPDHLHCLWMSAPGDNDFSKRWMLIKSNFTRSKDGRNSNAGASQDIVSEEVKAEARKVSDGSDLK